MKFAISKKNLLLFMVLFIFALLTVLFIIIFQEKHENGSEIVDHEERNYDDVTRSAVFPFHSLDHTYIGEDESWKLNVVQPIIVDVYERDTSIYAVGQLKLPDAGKLVNIEFFLLGKYGDGDDKESLILVYNDNTESLDLRNSDYKDSIVIGKQLRIKYISKFGSSDISFCNNLRVGSHLCSVNSHLFSTDVYDSYHINDNPVYIYSISNELENDNEQKVQ